MTYSLVWDKLVRLTILRILADAPGRTANTSVINSALKQMGFEISRDKTNSEVEWLQEQSLVKVDNLGPVRVVDITQRGLDVAEDRAINPGVERPSPGA